MKTRKLSIRLRPEEYAALDAAAALAGLGSSAWARKALFRVLRLPASQAVRESRGRPRTTDQDAVPPDP